MKEKFQVKKYIADGEVFAGKEEKIISTANFCRKNLSGLFFCAFSLNYIPVPEKILVLS